MKNLVEGLNEEYCEVSIDAIVENPDQPRKNFSDEELEELAASIRTVGLIQPLIVCRADGGYELVAGERRWRAARLVGMKKIPVLVRGENRRYSAEAALVENVQRVNLNPLEVARALKELEERFHLCQEELANRIGKRRSTVANYLRLLSLPNTIQDSLSAGLITMGHAKVILSVEGERQRLLLHEIILRDKLSVRESENVVLKLKGGKELTRRHKQASDDDLSEIVRQLQCMLGTKVVIESRGKKGRISIDYYSNDDLDRLLNILKVEL